MRSVGPQAIVHIQFPSKGLVLGDAALRWPGCTFDTLLEWVGPFGGASHLSCRTVVRGLTEPALDTLVQDLEDHYGRTEILMASPKSNQWIFRTHFGLDRIQSPTLRFIARFQDEFPSAWGHVEGGAYTVCALVQDKDRTEDLIALTRAFIRKSGVDATVEVIEASPSELLARETLLSHV